MRIECYWSLLVLALVRLLSLSASIWAIPPSSRGRGIQISTGRQILADRDILHIFIVWWSVTSGQYIWRNCPSIQALWTQFTLQFHRAILPEMLAEVREAFPRCSAANADATEHSPHDGPRWTEDLVCGGFPSDTLLQPLLVYRASGRQERCKGTRGSHLTYPTPLSSRPASHVRQSQK